jgi:hypothetical protein
VAFVFLFFARCGSNRRVTNEESRQNPIGLQEFICHPAMQVLGFAGVGIVSTCRCIR